MVSLSPESIKRIESFSSSLPRINSETEALKLAEKEGIIVEFYDLRGFKGVLAQRQGQTFLGVNKKLREAEEVKTILHELAHYFFHWNNRFRPIFLCHEYIINREEKEADFFAWCLMGEDWRETLSWKFLSENRTIRG
ncbi:MAG TPA: ImmA/IrrE family metallo-endopeptidase [Candidatus Atribacteria bacterium]|nr:ImmA/IrrE family metallo-endopeptidase [Candidatus Atribacteria bacterium]